MDTGFRNPVVRVLVYGHGWLAVGAAAQTWLVQALTDSPGWRAPLLAALATFTGYALMRLARAGHPQLGLAPHLVWTREHARGSRALLLVVLAGAVLVGWPHRAALWQAFWPLLVVVVLYVVPVRWAGGRTLGLRRVPLLKAFLIAAGWAWTTVALPEAMNGPQEVGNGLVWRFAMQGCFFLAIALVFDLRDREHDRGQVLTLPHLLGDRLTRIIAVLLMLYPATVFGMLAYIGRSMSELEQAPEWPMELVFAAFGHVVAAVVIACSSPRRGPLYFGLLVDGLLVLVPLLYAVGRLL